MKIRNLNLDPYYDQYKKLYQHPRWQEKRLTILKRDCWKCSRCGEDELPLHVHHDKYIYGHAPWEYEDEYLRTLCIYCHEEATAREAGRLAA